MIRFNFMAEKRGIVQKHLDAVTKNPPLVKSNTWYILAMKAVFNKEVS